MDKEIKPYVLHEELVEDHRVDGMRSGEGCLAALPGGELLLVYGRFYGPADHDSAGLVARSSHDKGMHWSAPEMFRESPPGALNIMSVSLLPLPQNRLAAVYMLKVSNSDCRPYFITCADNVRNWSAPVRVIDRAGYYVVNNDRLVRLNGGRLLVPYAYHGNSVGNKHDSVCGCAISDDDGAHWRIGAGEIKIDPENVRVPLLMDEKDAGMLDKFKERKIQCQEPGVIELLNGQVMMWCRSNGGYAYRAFSRDNGETWSSFEAIEEFSMPCGPQSIKRLPDTGRLVMLFNDRTGIPFGSPQFNWRRPLAIAVSDDDAATWHRYGLLEPDTVPSNCYYTICILDDRVLFTYYEGVMHTDNNGYYMPRNLASLKLKIVRRDYFNLPISSV